MFRWLFGNRVFLRDDDTFYHGCQHWKRLTSAVYLRVFGGRLSYTAVSLTAARPQSTRTNAQVNRLQYAYYDMTCDICMSRDAVAMKRWTKCIASDRWTYADNKSAELVWVSIQAHISDAFKRAFSKALCPGKRERIDGDYNVICTRIRTHSLYFTHTPAGDGSRGSDFLFFNENKFL